MHVKEQGMIQSWSVWQLSSIGGFESIIVDCPYDVPLQ